MVKYVFFILIILSSCHALWQIYNPTSIIKPTYEFQRIKGEDEAREYLKVANEMFRQGLHKSTIAEWNHASNLTEYNKKIKIEANVKLSETRKKISANISKFDWKNFKDPSIIRQCNKFSLLGDSVLPEKKLKKLKSLISDMEEIYATTKICGYNEVKPNCSLSLEPDITRIMANSRNFDQLLHVWKEWHDAVGPPIRPLFIQYVLLSNEAARLNNFSDEGALWRDEFETGDFEKDIEHLFLQVLPLYEQLHAYVRRNLINIYGGDKIDAKGGIPAHILGNMWGQTWGNLYPDTTPFPKKEKVDVTSSMKNLGYNALKMFKTAEDFFTSLGLPPMTPFFWKRSIFEKPKDNREMICHASAWNFYNDYDFRIKMCADVTSEDLITIHHEMGHIEYFMLYKDIPTVFREGANSGFHEAIGDTMALSVQTPQHLNKIKLLKKASDDEEADINFLYQIALDKVAFLPFGYLIDQWRWLIFSGKIKMDHLNEEWWKLRFKYQGLIPPLRRTESQLDPAAKYHVSANVPYVRYFVSFIVQFQFHKALCQAANHIGPLHKCDIYGSKEAGKRLSDMLKLGSSKPWSEIMKNMTGQAKMDASALMEYFQPLMKWLKEQNKYETLGWGYDWAPIRAKYGRNKKTLQTTPLKWRNKFAMGRSQFRKQFHWSKFPNY